MTTHDFDDHDFDDGNGPVPAHRHHNPDGSVGGWVADSAHVADTAYIGPEAKVSGNARVEDYAQICRTAHVGGNARISEDALITGNAHVFGNARIDGNVWVSGDARITGNAHISGDTGYVSINNSPWITGDARIRSTTDLLHISWVGNHDMTLCRSEDGYVLYAGCENTTIGEARERLTDPEAIWPDKDPETRELFAARWAAVLDLAEAVVRSWGVEP